MKFFKSAVWAFASLCLSVPMLAQMTTPTATQLRVAGNLITTGTVQFTPTDIHNTPIAVTVPGFGLYGPSSITCSIANGVLATSCSVPDSQRTTPQAIDYNIQVNDASRYGNPVTWTFSGVPNVTGTTWALDHYAPSASVSTSSTLQMVGGVGVPSGACTGPSIYTRTDATLIYSCVGSIWVAVAGVISGGGTTITANACTTGTPVASGISANGTLTCIAVPGGSPATATNPGTVQLSTGQTSSVLSKAATTGAYGDLSGTPTLGTAASQNATAFDTAGSATAAQTAAIAAAKSATTFLASAYAGADTSVKINACIAAAVANGGGTCDATMMGGSTTQAMSQQISVGSTSVQPYNTVSLLLPTTGYWTWGLTDGTSCGILQYGNTQIIGQAVGGLYVGGLVLDSTSSATNMSSLYCTEASPPTGGGYYYASGFSALNTTAGTFVNGLVTVQAIYDESHWERILARNPTGIAWKMSGLEAGSTFENIQGYGAGSFSSPSSNTTCQPLVITSGDTFEIRDSTFNGPCIGQHNVTINGTGSGFTSAPYNGVFEDIHMEKYNQSDNGTAMVYIGQYATNIRFIGGDLQPNCTAACVQFGFENHSTSGFEADNVGLDLWTHSAVNDVANGRQWVIPGYTINYKTVDSPQFTQNLSTDKLSITTPTGTLPITAGSSTFTPTTAGWYRVIQYATGGTVRGTMDIAGGYDNKFSDVKVDFAAQAYGNPGLISISAPVTYAASGGVIDQIETSGDNAANIYVDVHITDVTSPTPLTIVYYGQSIPPTAIVPSPVVGATPGAYSLAVARFDFFNGTNPPGYITTGPLEAPSFTSNYGNNIVTLPSASGVMALTAGPQTFTGAQAFTGLVSLSVIPSWSVATIASATTITPVTPMVIISGTTQIKTITLPTGFTSGCFDIKATGAWTTATGGNIQAAMTAVANTPYRACYYTDSSLWVIK